MSEHDTTGKGGDSSAANSKMEAELDNLVQRASAPNLAALFRKGKEAGLLKAQQEYVGAT